MRQVVKVPMEIKAKVWSTNQIYAGKHWSVRAGLKADMLLRTKSLFSKIPKVSTPCQIEFNFFNSTIRDVDNHSFLMKVLIDCLVAHKVIADDTSKYLTKVSLQVSKEPSFTGVAIRISDD